MSIMSTPIAMSKSSCAVARDVKFTILISGDRMHKHTVYAILISGINHKNDVDFPLISIGKVAFQKSCAPKSDTVFLLDHKRRRRLLELPCRRSVIWKRLHMNKLTVFKLHCAQLSLYIALRNARPVGFSNTPNFWQVETPENSPRVDFPGVSTLSMPCRGISGASHGLSKNHMMSSGSIIYQKYENPCL